MTDSDKEKGWEEPGDAAGEDPAETPAEGDDSAVREDDDPALLKTRLAYLAAEFDNYRKRAAREKEAIVSFGNERLLLAILPFLDNLERAISQSEAAGSKDALLEGVRITYGQILAELRKFGLEQIPAVGEPFDPNLHEAIAMVDREGKTEGTVLSEARKGYLLNGRLLRPAQVTVAKGATEGEPSGRFEQGRVDGEA